MPPVGVFSFIQFYKIPLFSLIGLSLGRKSDSLLSTEKGGFGYFVAERIRVKRRRAKITDAERAQREFGF
jgi:hypothetical protein